MTRVLVTAGAGFIGSHVVERLLQLGYEVSVIDDLNDFYLRTGNERNLAEISRIGSMSPGT
jgi:UDP-glucose 4-epimerase